MKRLIGNVLMAAALLTCASANASLLGDTVECTSTGAACSAATAQVTDPAVEFTVLGLFTINLSDSSIRLGGTAGGVASFVAGDFITLSDLDWVGTPGFIQSVTLATSPAALAFIPAGFDQNDISHNNNDSITIDLAGTSWTGESQAVLLIEAVHGVPEPTSVALLGLGLVGLAYRQRRKNG